MAQNLHTRYRNSATTTDGTTVADLVTSESIPDNSTFMAKCVFVGRDAAGNSARAEVVFGGKVVAGVLSMEGSSVTTIAVGGAVGLATSLPAITTAAGTTIKATIRGVAATTIVWVGFLELYIN